MLRLTLLFAVLIVYGSLFPLTGWSAPAEPLFAFLFTIPASFEKADLVQNLLAYMPFGLFCTAWLRRASPAGAALAIATVAGGLLSLGMETIQQFLPSRNASSVDLILNIVGSCCGGALAALLHDERFSGTRLGALRQAWIPAGTLPNLGLATLALWVLSQTSPLVPTFDMGQLRSGLALLYRALKQPENVVLAQLASYALFVAGLGQLARTLVRPGKHALLPFAALVACVFALKIIVEGRQLSLEALAGGAIGLLALLLAAGVRARAALCVSGILLVGSGFAVSELAAGSPDVLYAFNWIPLAGQMGSLNGLQNILELVWPFAAIGYFARCLTPVWRRAEVAVGGAVPIALALFALEWAQQSLPGRYGDITQVVLGLIGWILPWTFAGADFSDAKAALKPSSRPASSSRASGRG